MYLVCRLLLSSELHSLSLHDALPISAALKPERDLAFQFLGLQTLYDRYFLHAGGNRIELPQAFFMRVGMGLAMREIDREARAIEFYDLDRKSTRLNSSHRCISYAVFCCRPSSTLFPYTTLFRSPRRSSRNATWRFSSSACRRCTIVISCMPAATASNCRRRFSCASAWALRCARSTVRRAPSSSTI